MKSIINKILSEASSKLVSHSCCRKFFTDNELKKWLFSPTDGFVFPERWLSTCKLDTSKIIPMQDQSFTTLFLQFQNEFATQRKIWHTEAEESCCSKWLRNFSLPDELLLLKSLLFFLNFEWMCLKMDERWKGKRKEVDKLVTTVVSRPKQEWNNKPGGMLLT